MRDKLFTRYKWIKKNFKYNTCHNFANGDFQCNLNKVKNRDIIIEQKLDDWYHIKDLEQLHKQVNNNKIVCLNCSNENYENSNFCYNCYAILKKY